MKVVSIDDERINLLLIEQMSNELNLEISSFTSPKEGLTHIQEAEVDLIFVDYLMPEMDGITFIKQARLFHPDIPIVMITAVTSDSNLKLVALKSGATDFLNKPLDIAEFSARIANFSSLRKAQLFYKNWAELLEKEVRKATEDIRLREYETLHVLGKAAETRDQETANHIIRVAHYSKIIAEGLGENDEVQELVYHASPLHDVGKIGIPDSILLKPGKLDPDEYELMKTHTLNGYHMIDKSKSTFLQAGAKIALSHHEKFNGCGYPHGTSGKEIPLFGRIVAIADVFDALLTKRPYKEPWPLKMVISLMKEERGAHFDPSMVDCFLNRMDTVQAVYSTYAAE